MAPVHHFNLFQYIGGGEESHVGTWLSRTFGCAFEDLRECDGVPKVTAADTEELSTAEDSGGDSFGDSDA